ncbi:ArsR family transcriptional regulator [Kineococcus xinjiangensis]|uniref:ArsR family transcriptional regulator n=1 Tax=Kineococcus xinjiangensis TaxID=512762 RepID=A0A2S6IMK5_9ACTN|nr:ArsR family transcriptional regulator [Kineococcus xinjiangensis]
MKPPAGTSAEEGTAELLQVVADPVRWRILTLLAGEQLCTTHLQDLLGAKQTLVSHHLKVLREAGLVDTEPCGRFTYYRLRPGALDGLAEVVAGMAAASRGDVDRRAC